MSDQSEIESAADATKVISQGSLADGLVGVLLLCVAPRPALRLLFAGNWPKFLITLLLSYSVAPLLLAQVLPPTAGLAQLFIALNKQFPITPAGFTQACYLASVFGLPVGIFLLGLLQWLLLRVQGQSVPLIEGIAGLTYSAWPLFIALFARQMLLLVTDERAMLALGLALDNPISAVILPFSGFLLMFIQVLMVVAAGWGVWIWMRFIQGMTDLAAERVIATCIVICALPTVVVLIVVASYLIGVGEQGKALELSVPDLEHIRESLIFNPE